VRRYLDAAGVAKTGSCHLYRHTMATLMLEGGADIRFIQAILGHAELSTTQIYTRVSVEQLRTIHDATHPGSRNQPTRDRGLTGDETGDVDLSDDEVRRAVLFDVLDAEAAAEDDHHIDDLDDEEDHS
jgi:integrase/recombinase XerD